MSPVIQKYRKAVLRVTLLLCVYCLHLVFFQAAMAAKDTGGAKYFKTYLSGKANQKKGKASPAGFYLQFIKLASHGERPTISFPDEIQNSISPQLVVLDELPPVSRWFVYAHLPDDAFKLYERFSVFLI